MQKVPLYKERNEVAPGREGEGQRGRGRPREAGAGYPDDCVFTAAPTVKHNLYSLSGKQFKTFR